MHEGSVMREFMCVVNKVADEQEAHKVTGIHVRLGALSHFSIEHFREHFVQASVGTRAEGAALEVVLSEDINDPRAQDVVVESVEVEFEDDG